MISIILLAKIWFFLRVSALVFSPFMLKHFCYRKTCNRSYAEYVNYWLFKIVESSVWTALLWLMIWGEK